MTRSYANNQNCEASGRNISRCLRQWREMVGTWERRANSAESAPGLIMLWIGGNDIYPRSGRMGSAPGATGGVAFAAGVWAALREAVEWAAGSPVFYIYSYLNVIRADSRTVRLQGALLQL